MKATIKSYEGVGLFAANDYARPDADQKLKSVDPKVLLSIDVSLFRCLRKLGTSQERICSALLISNAEYEYVSELI